jgi:hypothetical protein
MSRNLRRTIIVLAALGAGWCAGWQVQWRLTAWDCERAGGGYDSALGCDVIPDASYAPVSKRTPVLFWSVAILAAGAGAAAVLAIGHAIDGRATPPSA